MHVTFCAGRLRVDSPASDVFTIGNSLREELAEAAWTQRLRHASARAPQALYICNECGAQLASAHLLDLHLCEAHDSFFAAQAARGMPVFRCLVEGCTERLQSVDLRVEHLSQVHHIVNAVEMSQMHLRKKKAKPKLEKRNLHRGPPVESRELMDVDAKASVSATDLLHGVTQGVRKLQFSTDVLIPHHVGFGRRRQLGLLKTNTFK